MKGGQTDHSRIDNQANESTYSCKQLLKLTFAKSCFFEARKRKFRQCKNAFANDICTTSNRLSALNFELIT